MIIAGVDEAGYGPLLGPLVVGCCAFEVDEAGDDDRHRYGSSPAPRAPSVAGSVPDGASAEPSGGAVSTLAPGPLPCVWSRLRRYVSRSRSKTGKTIHVNDSKLVYSPSAGIKELERAVLALAASTLVGEATRARSTQATGTSAAWPTSLDALLARVAPDCLPELAEHPWYAPADGEPFPLAQDGLPVRLFAKSLWADMDDKSARCVHLAARVVSERPYNRMVAATRNKASVLFTQAATHLDFLLRTYGDRDLTVFCDRQGGRSSYGPLLRLMFEEWALEVVEQSDGHSEYLLRRGGNTVRVLFAEKAEAQCLPVAVASMLSKYLREALMGRFNAYWQRQAPGVAPTAGYHPDGVRFAADIADARKRLGVRDEDLIRAR